MIFSTNNQMVPAQAGAGRPMMPQPVQGPGPASPYLTREAAAAANHELTADQRIGLTMSCVPLLHVLRSRILAYSILWCVAGAVLTLLTIPALSLKAYFLAMTVLIYGGSLIAFSIFRMIECRTIAALTESGRSELRRKVWLAFNGVVFVVALFIFMIALIDPEWMSPWVAMPTSIFVMLVSISPVWEWCFIYRVITNNKAFIEDFARALSLRYPHPEEMTALPVIVDSLYLLGKLQARGMLSPRSYAAIRDELIGLDGSAPAAAARASEVLAATRPW